MNVHEAMSSKSRLKPGDNIGVTTKQGGYLNIDVTELREDRIVGGSQQVLATDVERIEKKQFSPAKTTALMGLVIR